MTLNSDSIVWTLGLIACVLAFLVGVSDAFPPTVNLWLKIVSGVVGAVLLYLKNSPLPRTPWTNAQRAANNGAGTTPTNIVTLLLAAVLGVGLATCAPKMLVLTPQGQVAYTATEIGKRIGELGDAAISASKNGSLPDTISVPIVLFCYHTLKTLEETPNGWQQTVATAWASLKATIGAPTNPALAAAWGAVDVILAAFQPVPGEVPKIDPATLERLETWLSAQGVA